MKPTIWIGTALAILCLGGVDRAAAAMSDEPVSRPAKPPVFAGAPVSSAFCYALNAIFADAIRQQAKRDTAVSMAFSRAAARIEAKVMAPFADNVEARVAEEAKLLAALERFDEKAFDALQEPEAEAIISYCNDMAGPDL